MKKRIIYSILVLFVLIIVILVADMLTGRKIVGSLVSENNNSDNNEEIGSFERIAKVMETTIPTKVFLLGENVDFEGYYSPQKITSLNSDTLIKDDSDYYVCIINDLSDDIDLSENEIEYIREWINENGNMLIYLGKKYSDKWDDPEMPIANVEGNLYYEYYSWDGVGKRVIGGWTEEYQKELNDHPSMLGQAILSAIEDYIQ